MPKLTFTHQDGRRQTVEARSGHSLLEIAHQHGVDLEGACEGSMACSTCHLVIAPAWFERLPAPSEEEEDMLDLASDLTRTSRLGCQVIMQEDWDGLEVSLPAHVRDMALS